MIRVIGIDPGIKGAFCVLEVSGSFLGNTSKPTIRLVTIQDFPVFQEIKSKLKNTKRNRIDLSALALKINQYSDCKIALMEDVGKMPTQSDPLASFAFGYATGAVAGMLAAEEIPTEKIKPEVWKASYGLTADKKKSIELAKRLVPESAPFIHLAKHDGRAEALLLAHFAATHLRFK